MARKKKDEGADERLRMKELTIRRLRTQIKRLKAELGELREGAHSREVEEAQARQLANAAPDVQLAVVTERLRAMRDERLDLLVTYPIRQLMGRFCELRADEVASDLNEARASMEDTSARIKRAAEGTEAPDASEMMVLDEIIRVLIERSALLTKLELGWRREAASWGHSLFVGGRR